MFLYLTIDDQNIAISDVLYFDNTNVSGENDMHIIFNDEAKKPPIEIRCKFVGADMDFKKIDFKLYHPTQIFSVAKTNK